MVIPILTKGKSTKDKIIDLLSSEWPLSLKRIYGKLKKRYGINISYQATHKAINELVEEKVLQKVKKEYKLNIEWVNNLERFSKKIKDIYLKKERIPYIEVGCGSSIEKDAYEAGKEAAEKAINEIKFYKKYNLALAFISSDYEGKFDEVLKGVYSI
jgi:chromosome condensin MukBEF complex kleisin-like MukF subunit